MNFLDTNVLVYALLEPRREVTDEEKSMLANAKQIMQRINNGEKVLFSVVHLSEFVNIVQRRLSVEKACVALQSLFSLSNIRIESVGQKHYQRALIISQKTKISLNDCVAIVIMSDFKCKKIYSFDSDFDRIGSIRVTK